MDGPGGNEAGVHGTQQERDWRDLEGAGRREPGLERLGEAGPERTGPAGNQAGAGTRRRKWAGQRRQTDSGQRAGGETGTQADRHAGRRGRYGRGKTWVHLVGIGTRRIRDSVHLRTRWRRPGMRKGDTIRLGYAAHSDSRRTRERRTREHGLWQTKWTRCMRTHTDTYGCTPRAVRCGGCLGQAADYCVG